MTEKDTTQQPSDTTISDILQTQDQHARSLVDIKKALDTLVDLYYRTHRFDQTVFDNNVTFNQNIKTGKDGVRIGTHTTDKLSTYGVLPVVQAAAIIPPSDGGTQDSQARTAIGLIITALKNFGITA